MTLLDSLEIKEITTKNQPNSSSFVFQHLPVGMGVTIGNFFRRVLLSYVSGIAPVAVKISDKNGWVKSKFTALSGVVEKTPYLIVNLEKIIWEEKKEKDGLFSLELKIENKEKEEKIVTAADFSKIPEIEIKNPELYLATLAPGGKLEIIIYCQKNWGYHQAEEQKKLLFSEDDDIIALDSDYSPVKGGQVSFQVKSAIIGIEKEEEELTLIITTDGAIKPKKALEKALEISQDSFNSINKSINNSNKKEEKMLKEIK